MPITYTFSNVGTADAGVLAYLLGIANGGNPSITGSSATASSIEAAPAVNSFPSDPALAPVSPENSEILVTSGKLGGVPYLKDLNGNVYTLAPVTGGYGIFLNSQQITLAGNTPVTEALVRQSKVYWMISGGVWQYLAANGTAYNVGGMPPPAFAATSVGSTSSAVQLPPLPATPVPSATAPGSSGRVIQLTAGQTIAYGISQAVSGDTVKLVAGGLYKEAATWNVPILFDGQGSTIDVSGIASTALPHQLGAVVPCADSIIQNLTVKGAGMDKTSADGTAGIRPGGNAILVLNNVNAIGNQNGVFSGGFVVALTINSGTLDSNGLSLSVDPNGASHNLYFAAGGSYSLKLNNVTSTNPVAGHAVKCRAPILAITGGTMNAANATVIDIPDGSTTPFSINGTMLNKGANDANHGILGYALESQNNGLAGGAITGGTINANCSTPLIQTSGGTITMTSVARSGNTIAAQGVGTVIGL